MQRSFEKISMRSQTQHAVTIIIIHVNYVHMRPSISDLSDVPFLNLINVRLVYHTCALKQHVTCLNERHLRLAGMIQRVAAHHACESSHLTQSKPSLASTPRAI